MSDVRSMARGVIDVARTSGPLWAAALVLDRLVPGGVLRAWAGRQVRTEVLTAQLEAILRAWGMSEEHAVITAGHMLYADAHGIDSHGSAMLRYYHRALAERRITMVPRIEVLRQSETTALIDGGGGLGHVPAHRAMNLAIEKCLAAGTACVAVRNSGHYGAAGAYASMAARAGLIGIATTTTREPALVPTFGVTAMLGTNPIAFAAPAARNRPFLLDMSTSTAPVGKLNLASRRGRSIPRGWALDGRGRAVTSARDAARFRRLTPLGSTSELGSHKGYGLAAAVEILSSALSGNWRAPDCADEPGRRVGHFFLAIDPRQFRETGELEADVDDLMDRMRACAPADPRQRVLVAGDPEYAAFDERARTGIPLSRSVVEDIRAVARASGVPFVLEQGKSEA